MQLRHGEGRYAAIIVCLGVDSLWGRLAMALSTDLRKARFSRQGPRANASVSSPAACHIVRGRKTSACSFSTAIVNSKTMRMLDKISRVHLLAASCCAVLLLAGGLVVIGFVSSEKLYRKEQSEIQASPDALPSSPPPDLLEPLVVPGPTRGRANSNIQQAMARCDAEAAQDPNSQYFLLTPVLPMNFESATLLLPPGEPHKSFFLIPSQLVLGGLEDGSLELSSRPYAFSLRNSQTGEIQNWRPANGPAQFKLPNAASLSRFQIGLGFADAGVEWTGEYDRPTGACYWVNSFLPARLYSPFPGRSYSTMSKSFPSPAQTLRCANRACERDGDS